MVTVKKSEKGSLLSTSLQILSNSIIFLEKIQKLELLPCPVKRFCHEDHELAQDPLQLKIFHFADVMTVACLHADVNNTKRTA